MMFHKMTMWLLPALMLIPVGQGRASQAINVYTQSGGKLESLSVASIRYQDDVLTFSLRGTGENLDVKRNQLQGLGRYKIPTQRNEQTRMADLLYLNDGSFLAGKTMRVDRSLLFFQPQFSKDRLRISMNDVKYIDFAGSIRATGKFEVTELFAVKRPPNVFVPANDGEFHDSPVWVRVGLQDDVWGIRFDEMPLYYPATTLETREGSIQMVISDWQLYKPNLKPVLLNWTDGNTQIFIGVREGNELEAYQWDSALGYSGRVRFRVVKGILDAPILITYTWRSGDKARLWINGRQVDFAELNAVTDPDAMISVGGNYGEGPRQSANAVLSNLFFSNRAINTAEVIQAARGLGLQ